MSEKFGCSAPEWDARVDLAALYRLTDHYGWTDLTSTHISARVPDDDDCYLLNSRDLLFEEICASNLSRVTFSGEAVGAVRLNLAAHVIHSNILRARPDINFVIHTHTRAGIAVASMPGGLRPLSQHAGFVLGTIASHPYRHPQAADDEGELLARDLGDNYVMLLQNHGLLSVGRTAAEAFIYHYMAETACRIQVDILSCTDSPIELTEEVAQGLARWAFLGGTRGKQQWPALMRLLDRKDPSFRE